jgi:hypothetical protein
MSKAMTARILMIVALSTAALAAQRGGGKIVGRVLDRESFKTLPAEIAIAGRDERALFLTHARASEKGLFESPDLPAGDLHLTTKLKGYAVEHLSVSLNNGETRFVEFYLIRGKTVRGVVVDKSQMPAPGVRVRLSYLAEATENSPVTASYQWEEGEAFTDEQGRFEINDIHPQREFVVEATHTNSTGAVSAPMKFTRQDKELSVNLSIDSGKRKLQ